MERDPFDRDQGGSDVGRDLERDFGDEPPAAIRDAAPDYLAPIDDSAPVSGHSPPPETSASACRHARARLGARQGPRLSRVPAGRNAGRAGRLVRPAGRHGRRPQSHTQPLIDEGPAGLPVVYALDAGAFDVIVSGDHLRSWGIGPVDAAGRGDGQPDDVVGVRAVDRRDLRRTPLVSSDTGDGWDAARILLPDVVDHLTRELGAARPDPHRPAGAPPARGRLAAPERRRFASLFADFVLETSGGADEPVDRRVFELVGGRLVEFAGVAARLTVAEPAARGLHDPPLRGRRRDRDDHARSARGAQRAHGRSRSRSCSPPSNGWQAIGPSARSC